MGDTNQIGEVEASDAPNRTKLLPIYYDRINRSSFQSWFERTFPEKDPKWIKSRFLQINPGAKKLGCSSTKFVDLISLLGQCYRQTGIFKGVTFRQVATNGKALDGEALADTLINGPDVGEEEGGGSGDPPETPESILKPQLFRRVVVCLSLGVVACLLIGISLFHGSATTSRTGVAKQQTNRPGASAAPAETSEENDEELPPSEDPPDPPPHRRAALLMEAAENASNLAYYPDALEKYEEADKILKEVAVGSVDKIEARHGVGGCHYSLGNVEEAKEIFKETWEGFLDKEKEIRDAGEPTSDLEMKVTIAQIALATAWYDLDRSDVTNLTKSARNRIKRLMKSEQPPIKNARFFVALHDLGNLLLAHDEPAEALKYHTIAFEGLKQGTVLGETHHHTIIAKMAHATDLALAGQKPAAEKLFIASEATVLDRNVFPIDNIWTAVCLANLCFHYDRLKLYERHKAIVTPLHQSYQALCATSEFGPGHPRMLAIGQNLAIALGMYGELAKGISVMKQVVSATEASDIPGQAKLIWERRHGLAKLYRHAQQTKEADELHQQLLAHYSQTGDLKKLQEIQRDILSMAQQSFKALVSGGTNSTKQPKSTKHEDTPPATKSVSNE